MPGWTGPRWEAKILRCSPGECPSSQEDTPPHKPRIWQQRVERGTGHTLGREALDVWVWVLLFSSYFCRKWFSREGRWGKIFSTQ
jgi:hypothetical protein